MTALRHCLLLVACLGLTGCGWITSLWPRGQKTVPVTQPADPGQKLAFDQEPVPIETPDTDPPDESDPDDQTQITTNPDDHQGEPAHNPMAEDPPNQIGGETLIANRALMVGSSFVTADDILSAASWELSKIGPGVNQHQFRVQAATILKRAIEQQIEQTAVLEKAEIEITDQQREALDAQIKRIRKDMVARSGGSEKKLEAQMIKEGTTLDAVLDRQRKQMIYRSFLREKISDGIVVTRRQLWDYYQRNIDDYTSDRKIQIRLIAAPLREFANQADPAAAARKQIDQAQAALGEGTGFAEVAKKFSKGRRAASGGLWPQLAAGSMREREVEKQAFSLKVGQVSDIISTETGFYIVTPVAVEPGTVVSFLDAQKEIEKKIRNAEALRLRIQYGKNLRKEAMVLKPPQLEKLLMEKAFERYFVSE